jgi:hypothetical protein
MGKKYTPFIGHFLEHREVELYAKLKNSRSLRVRYGERDGWPADAYFVTVTPEVFIFGDKINHFEFGSLIDAKLVEPIPNTQSKVDGVLYRLYKLNPNCPIKNPVYGYN